jgi:TPR repeat protein
MYKKLITLLIILLNSFFSVAQLNNFLTEADGNTIVNIADNLHIKVKGQFPTSHPPLWNHVTQKVEWAASTGNDIMLNMESYLKQYASGQIEEAISIGNYNGKAVVFFSIAIGCIYMADIDIYSNDTYVNAEPKTFQLLNFRPVPNPYCSSEMKKMTGTITLSADQQSTITFNMVRETYDPSGQKTFHFATGDFSASLINSAAVSTEYADNEKYVSFLDKFGKQHYDGWNYDKLYAANSIRNVRVIEKDSHGRPTVIKGDCQLGYYNAWIEVLLNNETAYGVIFSPGNQPDSLTCVTPPKNSEPGNAPYTPAELQKIQLLQDQYMISHLNKTFDNYPPESRRLKYLVPDTYYSVVTKFRKVTACCVPVMTSQGVESTTYQKDEAYGETVGEKGLRNSSNNDIVICKIGMERKYGGTAVKYADASITIGAGKTVPYVDFSYKKYNYQPPPDGEVLYFSGGSIVNGGSNFSTATNNDDIVPYKDAASSALRAIYATALAEYKAKKYEIAFPQLMKISNYAPAQHIIADYYYSGYSPVSKNEKLSMDWEMKGALQGYPASLDDVSYNYDHGVGVEQDNEAGFLWAKKAAKTGDGKGESMLGEHYGKGVGVAEDLEQAVIWYKKAAFQGDHDAEYFLGFAYYNGVGIQKDPKEGTIWMVKAAKQGNHLAVDFCKMYYIPYQ